MFFIQVVCGRPGGRLQFSGGSLKMAWLASVIRLGIGSGMEAKLKDYSENVEVKLEMQF